jgi:hypothetical protein
LPGTWKALTFVTTSCSRSFRVTWRVQLISGHKATQTDGSKHKQDEKETETRGRFPWVTWKERWTDTEENLDIRRFRSLLFLEALSQS